MTIYLDHNATTRPSAEVVAGVVEMMGEGFGNAASSHRLGRIAKARIDGARDQLATLLSVGAARIVWTSGSTEALNTALASATACAPTLLVPKAEHKAVLDTAAALEATGVEVIWLDVDADGALTQESLLAALPSKPFVLAVMAANNETGTLNDIPSLTAIAHDHDGVVVCDATQQVGKLPIDLSEWGVDYAAVSGHKFHGPAGVGAMIVPSGVQARPLIHGGGHQRGWRSGTLNSAGIVGLGIAAEHAATAIADQGLSVAALRDRLFGALSQTLSGLTINGAGAPRLPNTLNVQIPGVDADALIVNCPGVAFSSGSACTSAVPSPSHVLTAMGLSSDQADQSIRLSLGSATTVQEVDDAAAMLVAAAIRLRELTGWAA